MNRTRIPTLAACLLITLSACSDDDGHNQKKQVDAAAQDASAADTSAAADTSTDTVAAPDAGASCAKGTFFALSAKKVGKDGKVIKRWGTNITPDNAEIETAITTALGH